ncbi:MAG TPA: tRNA (adenosine(37)-N6)-threonylcarbamoyltransferase complex dimerization subunit type 1 TsaB, partial [Roseovarius sp.]|nr:tRNA (adenosine(37)-N6)-threonylcarbamoyltransferase complex dimerization subunit type 1 TsaB [Roseovarius sp.]
MVCDAALVLGFDTSAAHCAAALLCGEQVLAVRAAEMGRGQAEHLMPLLQDILAEAGVTWADLDRIGVGVGPGNFTGIRISVSAARGLALALNIPALGVSGFEAVAQANPEPHIAVLPGPRGMCYVQA